MPTSPLFNLRPNRWLARIALFAVCAMFETPYTAPASAASPAMLVKDINTLQPSNCGSLLDQAVTLGTTTFFSATPTDCEGIHAGLYTTDGSSGNTALVADIQPQLLTVYGQRVFFFTGNGTPGDPEGPPRLWSTDGTTAGTVAFKDFDDTVRGAISMVALPTALVFLMQDQETNAYSLWNSDGTSAGTSRIYQPVLPFGDFLSPLVVAGSSVFFHGYDASSGGELWRSDGTAAGTTLVADLTPGNASSSLASLTAVGSNLFFLSDSAIWKTDGTAAGTAKIKDIDSTISVTGLTNVAGNLFFVTFQPESIFATAMRILWKSNGTASGTVAVKTLPDVNSTSLNPIDRFTAAGSRLFFALENSQGTIELWTSDGTDAGTIALKTLGANTSGVQLQPFISIGTTLFFSSFDATTTNGLWKTDGTIGGSVLVKAISANAIPAEPINLYSANGILLFFIRSDTEGVVLWRSDGTTAGTLALKRFTSLTADAFLSKSAAFVPIGDTVYFVANDDLHGYDLWKSDGTAAGTSFVKDTTTNYQGPSDLVAVGNRLFFSANDDIHGYELWTSDGTSAGTQMVKDIDADSTSSNIRDLVDFNGSLFFIANDGTTGAELWKSDGTAAGTVRLTDLNPGVANGVYSLAVAGNKLFLTGEDPIHGIELWISDGSAAGTTLLKDIVAGEDSSQFSGPLNIIQLTDRLLFTVPLGPDAGLWQTDGTTAGTTLVKAGVAPALNAATVSNGKLFFLGNDTSSGQELWASDGTADGTAMVKDIQPGSVGSFPSQFTNLNGTLLFVANDGAGSTLWKTDGSEAGTVRLAIGTGSSTLTTVAALTALPEKGIAVFAGSTLQSGSELWQTDGTPQNTRQLVDIAAGPASANPYTFVLTNGVLAFIADDGQYGTELWRYDFAAPSSSNTVYLPFMKR